MKKITQNFSRDLNANLEKTPISRYSYVKMTKELNSPPPPFGIKQQNDKMTFEAHRAI